ncbi:hypothetical protein NM688_g3248 [Phlebia brevispora]|uniref:Uncharacterized protein n=1 Tax=Phlebia brevispora TaxID=194682 RepID=A0ACC1T6B0_9APHY|nr:hypothetical protein NM688_g3248 [Phlebia brevispora]
MSPTATSPTSPRKPVPNGFIAYKPKQKPIKEMSVRELQDLHARNVSILSEPAPSTSSYVQRISAEQAQIEARLVELGVDGIRKMLHETTIQDEAEQMNVDNSPQEQQQDPQENNVPRPIGAKLRALQNFSAQIPHADAGSNIFTYQEAMQIEREAHALDMQRQKEHEEKVQERRRRMGLPLAGEKRLTREEQEARIWAFMSYKPTDSDLEDEDEYDSDDDDPANWFEDDQDDGRKGQDIIEPDYEDLTNIIRIDSTRIPRNDWFDPPEA